MHRNFSKILFSAALLFSLSVQANWHATEGSREQTKILNQVETRVAQTQTPVVIFDLDSTLYDNRSRSVAIWREYGKLHKVARLTHLKADQITSYVLEDYLVQSVKLDAQWVSDHLKKLKLYWAERFFSNAYVKYDQPLPGAVAYVKSLHKEGATIVYITGRDDGAMRAGTESKFKHDGFPIGVVGTKLLMKSAAYNLDPKKFQSDGDYKAALKKNDNQSKLDAIAEAKKLGTVVAAFDNEPAAINQYYQQLHRDGKALAVWLDTDHFPNPEPLKKDVVSIAGFKR